jgi:hypothetical protein
MRKKEIITEAKRKALLADREKAIVESFAKNFNKIKRLDEAYGMSFEEAKAEAKRISDEEGGVVQHVNQVGEDKFIVSDFFDSDTTVASFGLGIDEAEYYDGDDYEQASRGVEYGFDPYAERPSLFDGVDRILVSRPESMGGIMNIIYGIYIIYKNGEQEKIRSVEEFNQKFGTDIPLTKDPREVVSYLETNYPEVTVYLDEFDVS